MCGAKGADVRSAECMAMEICEVRSAVLRAASVDEQRCQTDGAKLSVCFFVL